MEHKAAESLSLAESQERLECSIAWVRTVLSRLEPLLPGGRLKVLELGAAQGRSLIGLAREGHDACGVEPHVPAIEVAEEMAKQQGLEIDLRAGRAESIPFASNSFDLVLAFEVMEHVEDLGCALAEVFRVLRPGGVFWFSSASAMCPRQHEIGGFPCFGWYPQRLKLAIMRWAVAKRPHLVGGTAHPAVHWWTPWTARTRLRHVGFTEVWDRWDLRLTTEDSGLRQHVAILAKRSRLLRLLGDLLRPGCSYAAKKGSDYVKLGEAPSQSA